MAVHKERADRPWRCLMCYGFFKSSNSLALHENLAHNRQKGNSKYPCQVCFKLFSRAHLKEHVRIHSQDRPFSCPYCPRRFRLIVHIKVHLRTIHGKTWSRARLNSLRSLHKEPEIKIEEGIHDDTSSSSSRPKVEKRTLPLTVDEGGNGGKQAFRCPYCLEVSVEGKEFIEHLRGHKKKRLDTSLLPPKIIPKADTDQELAGRFPLRPCKIILRRCDSLISNSAKPSTFFKTGTKTLGKRNHKTNHARCHTITHLNTTKLYKCSQCFARFTLRASLHRHMLQTHAPERSYYDCLKCHKGFISAANLKRHVMVVHEGQKRYQCGGCSKAFFDKSDVTRHERRLHPDLRIGV